MEQPLDNTTNVLRALKHIAENQEKLLQKTTRLLQTQNQVQSVPQTVTKIPLDVKRNIRVAVSSCSTKWDFSQSFRSQRNEEVNKEIFKNVKALGSMEKVDGFLIQRSLKSHFLGKRRTSKLKEKGCHEKIKQRERRRHRINEKLRLRKHITGTSSAFNDAQRRKIMSALVMESMSPEVSASETESSDDDLHGSDDESPPTAIRRKALKSHPLSWRSDELVAVLQSLDRKIMRQKSEKARSMVMKRQVGDPIIKDPPQGMPSWAVKKA